MVLLRDGAAESPDEGQRQVEVARWVWDLLAPGYGPGGGHVLVEDRLLRASAALRELPSEAFRIAPYRRLMSDLSEHAGDQACLAGLLASGLVKAVEGQRRAAAVEGLRLARRQVLAWIDAHAAPATPEEAAHDVDPALRGLWEGLLGLADDGHLDLEAIAVRGADVEAPAWSDGVVLEASDGAGGDIGVLLIDSLALPRPRTEASLRLASSDAGASWEAAAVARMRQRVRELGAGLVVCAKDVPEDLAGGLAFDGVQTVHDAPIGLMTRIARATDAVRVPDLDRASPDDIGRGGLSKRRKQWRLTGSGHAATLEVPAIGPAKEMREEAAERWLRMAGRVILDPRTLPGGGAWQRDVARTLRQAAPHASGRIPVTIEAVAGVFDRIADAIAANQGDDPLDVRSYDGIVDPAVCVRMAVTAGFETALHIVKVDAAWLKRGSNPLDLRGNLGKAGSPKGMPGDVPPDM